MGRDLRISLHGFQENHRHAASFESTQARSTLTLVYLSVVDEIVSSTLIHKEGKH